MWLKKKRAQITLPAYVMDYLEGLGSEMGSNKSDTIEAVLLYVSMPENEEDFKSQFGEAEEVGEEDIEDADEDDDEEEEEVEEE